MKASTIFLSLALLWVAPMARAQDPQPLLSRAGCHVYRLLDGVGQAISADQVLGEATLERQHDGRRFRIEFELVIHATLCSDPSVPLCGSFSYLSTIRFPSNGTLVVERWTGVQQFDDPVAPTGVVGDSVSEVISGNRYTTGSSGARFETDLATGVVTYPKATFIYCTEQDDD